MRRTTRSTGTAMGIAAALLLAACSSDDGSDGPLFDTGGNGDDDGVADVTDAADAVGTSDADGAADDAAADARDASEDVRDTADAGEDGHDGEDASEDAPEDVGGDADAGPDGEVGSDAGEADALPEVDGSADASDAAGEVDGGADVNPGCASDADCELDGQPDCITASCDTDSGTCSYEATGDCATNHPCSDDADNTAGSTSASVTSCVCRDHPECCTSGWGASCAARARTDCGADCVCDNPEERDCEVDSDCSFCGDGNACNGVWECDVTDKTCTKTEGISCPDTDPNDCIAAACDPDTGECSDSKPLSTECDDGDPCTKDTCKPDGTCAFEQIEECGENPPCETAETPGTSDDEIASCVCNQSEQLETQCCEVAWTEECVVAAIESCGLCDDGDACTYDTCGEGGECTHEPTVDSCTGSPTDKEGIGAPANCNGAEPATNSQGYKLPCGEGEAYANTLQGCCDPWGRSVWCGNDGLIHCVDCAAGQQYCGWDSASKFYTCGTSGNPAPGGDPAMTCDGEQAN